MKSPLQKEILQRTFFAVFYPKDRFAPSGASFFVLGGKETKTPLGAARPKTLRPPGVDKCRLPGAHFRYPGAPVPLPLLPRSSQILRPTNRASRGCGKCLAEFRARRRETNLTCFLRRRVRRRKYFSRSERLTGPPLADHRGAQRNAAFFIEEPWVLR